jgi:hypothetical protein
LLVLSRNPGFEHDDHGWLSGWPKAARTKTPQAFWRPAAIGLLVKRFYRSRKRAPAGENQ